MKSSTWSTVFQLLTILCLGLIAMQLYRLDVKTTRTNKFILEALQENKKGKLDAIAPEDIILGDPQAPGTIIMYSQTDCDHCQAFLTGQYSEIQEHLIDTRKAKFVLRFLTHLKDSADVQRVKQAYCLGGEGYLQSLIGTVQPDSSFVACMASRSLQPFITTSATQARIAGIRVTPYFIVNGQHLAGIKNLAKFEELLESS